VTPETASKFEALEAQAHELTRHFCDAGFEMVAPAIIQPADVFLDAVGEDLRQRAHHDARIVQGLARAAFPATQRTPTGKALSSTSPPCARRVLRPSDCHFDVAPMTTATGSVWEESGICFMLHWGQTPGSSHYRTLIAAMDD